MDDDQRAMEDALGDMASEGIDMDELLKEIGVVTYVASYYTENEDGVREHGICKVAAHSFEEAVGRVYIETSAEYPAHDGWLAPHIVVDTNTYIVIPGVASPVLYECPDPEPTPGV